MTKFISTDEDIPTPLTKKIKSLNKDIPSSLTQLFKLIR